jgi:hypothetical protein
MFIAALFLISRRWKLPKCSPTYDNMKKMSYIQTKGYYSHTKVNFGTWYDVDES